jgi:fructuronate reductase
MFDAYDRTSLRPTVVHIGPGVFHRAHQAVYSDALLRSGARDGACWGVSLRSSGVRDALAPDDFVYDVVERSSPYGGEPAGVDERIRSVGSILGIDVLPEGAEVVLERLVDPAVTVVTVTVTEHGYCAVEPGGALDTDRVEVAHDLRRPEAPRSLPGLLLESLVRRRAAGLAPFTVASCDNLPSNGDAVRRVVRDLAECRDPALATWVDGAVAFPSSMVDRMVPSIDDDDRSAASGCAARSTRVLTEPFSQWVLADTFPSGRPDWGAVGVELVGDVHAHEQAKLRILNAAHCALAYWGLLCGYDQIWQSAADPELAAATRELIELEAIPSLDTPPGWDLHRYAEVVLERFANRALPYTNAKVAGDGSHKLPVRVIPTVCELVRSGRPAPRSAQLLAAWAATMLGPSSARLDISDPALFAGDAADMVHRARVGGVPPESAVTALLGLPGFGLPDSPGGRTFVDAVSDGARSLWQADARPAVSRLLSHRATSDAAPDPTPNAERGGS